jgi:acyl-CoA thioester hydrolase
MSVRWSETARPEWVDYNGHLSEAYYVLILGHATDAVMDAVGLDAASRERTGASLFTAEAHVRYVEQVVAGDVVEVRSSIIGVSEKVLWIWHELAVADRVRATEEILGVYVDVASGRAQELPSEVRRAAEAMRHEPPPGAGRRIEIR